MKKRILNYGLSLLTARRGALWRDSSVLRSRHQQHGVVDWYRNNKAVKEKGYSTTLLGNEAVKLINEHDPATPLYLYLAFKAAHTPYQATPEYHTQTVLNIKPAEFIPTNNQQQTYENT